MFDVLVYLYETGGPFAHVCTDGDALSEKLTAVGFSTEEVGAALTWLQALKQERPAPALATHPHTFRVFAAFERQRLGDDGLALLVFLEAAGQLSADERELVIERALAVSAAPVALAELKVIVLMVLWSRQADIDSLLIEELLDDAYADEDDDPAARGLRH